MVPLKAYAQKWHTVASAHISLAKVSRMTGPKVIGQESSLPLYWEDREGPKGPCGRDAELEVMRYLLTQGSELKFFGTLCVTVWSHTNVPLTYINSTTYVQEI